MTNIVLCGLNLKTVVLLSRNVQKSRWNVASTSEKNEIVVRGPIQDELFRVSYHKRQKESSLTV